MRGATAQRRGDAGGAAEAGRGVDTGQRPEARWHRASHDDRCGSSLSGVGSSLCLRGLLFGRLRLRSESRQPRRRARLRRFSGPPFPPISLVPLPPRTGRALNVRDHRRREGRAARQLPRERRLHRLLRRRRHPGKDGRREATLLLRLGRRRRPLPLRPSPCGLDHLRRLGRRVQDVRLQHRSRGSGRLGGDVARGRPVRRRAQPLIDAHVREGLLSSLVGDELRQGPPSRTSLLRHRLLLCRHRRRRRLRRRRLRFGSLGFREGRCSRRLRFPLSLSRPLLGCRLGGLTPHSALFCRRRYLLASTTRCRLLLRCCCCCGGGGVLLLLLQPLLLNVRRLGRLVPSLLLRRCLHRRLLGRGRRLLRFAPLRACRRRCLRLSCQLLLPPLLTGHRRGGRHRLGALDSTHRRERCKLP